MVVVVFVVMGACPGVSASRLMGGEMAPLYARHPFQGVSRKPPLPIVPTSVTEHRVSV